MLKHLFKRSEGGLEGIRRPGTDVTVTFVLMFRDLEIGRLRFEGDQWHFAYSDAFRAQHELQCLTNFPDPDRNYQGADLWPFFAQRIPSLQQPAVQRFMRQHDLTEVDESSLLRQFGRRTVANPFELLPAA